MCESCKILLIACSIESENIQIKIALSADKVRILIKILAERHMAFDLENNIDIRFDPDLVLPHFKACYMRISLTSPAG